MKRLNRSLRELERERMAFIHDEAYFSEKSICERARIYGFSDPLPVELFLWNCEIAAQLQNESEKFVLKGGAAAQLHLPVEMQRGSVDVDVVCPFTKQEIAEVLLRIHERIPTVEFEKYKPKRSKKEISMLTYLARMPAVLPSDGGRPREIKIDFLLEDLTLPTQIVTNVETFAVKVKRLRCYSITSLIGDKLLTLAENTIGIADSTDIPKQVYDVSVLSEKHSPTSEQFSEIVDVTKTVAPLEAGYRELKTTVAEALADVKQSMDKYGVLDTTGANSDVKRNIANFQQFYVSASQRRPLYEWCARALRIRFLSELLKATIEEEIAVEEACKEYNLAIQTAQLLTTFSGEKVRALNKQLMDAADKEIPYFKSLKGKPLHRVFWQIVSRKNLSIIYDFVKNQTV
jgi:hypothetical protein